MGALRCIVLVGVPVLCLTTGGTEAANSPAFTYSAARVNCRPAMNAARSKAGLANFGEPTDANKLPITKIADYGANQAGSMRSRESRGSGQAGADPTKDTFLESVCQAVMSVNGAPPTQEKQAAGTYMYAPQGSPEEMCGEAVDFWSGAATHFPALPPAYSTNQDLYKDDKNVSFVGLYNPNANPTVDCAIITCQLADKGDEDEKADKEMGHDQRLSGEPVASADYHEREAPVGDHNPEVDRQEDGESPVVEAAPLTANPPVEGHESERSIDTDQAENAVQSEKSRRLSAKPDAVYTLLCLSRPPALKENQMPFTEQQWVKIKGGTSGAVQSQVYAVFTLGAAALMHSLF
ncbi:hypothetical protein Emag_001506 [Eimeria magna]